MPKKDGSPTVAEKRAAGTNKAAQNQAAKAAGTFKSAPKSAAKVAAKADRTDNYNSQSTTQASDFDFGQETSDKVGNGEAVHLRQQGYSREQIQQAAQNSGLEIGKNAQKRFDRWDARAAAKEKAQQVVQNPVKQPVEDFSNANVEQEPNTIPIPKPPINSPDPIINKPVRPPITKLPGIGTPIKVPGTSIENDVTQSQDQEVNQDNDINSTVTGDGNNVNISQDNSVRQYGGVNKSFIYNSTNGNNYMDTPVSAGTMGGYFYDADSPARSASFIDRYTTMNDDYQKKYDNTNIANNAIANAKNTQSIDVNALDQRIADRAKLSRARSTSMAGDIFGDMFNYNPKEWEAPGFSGDDV